MSCKRVKLYTEPYYPPGYCGYSPQFHFQFGDTYGKTTSRLLTDPKVAKSGNMVLADIVPKKVSDVEKHTRVTDWQRQRKQSWGDHKLTDKMVPGYTGYIPKKEDHFGNRYAKICKAAISDFDHEQQVYHDKRRALMIRKPSMKQQRIDSKPYVSLNQVQHSVSPYFMSEKRSEKTFMSGYTGFIPRSRSRFAMGYPNLTMEALIEFTRHQQYFKTSEKRPVNANENNKPESKWLKANTPDDPIYLDSGLLPHYTGYLPGHKFRFGDTYGTSSRYFHEAKNKGQKFQQAY